MRKPSPPLQSLIDEELAANIKALGINGDGLAPVGSARDRVFEGYVKFIRKNGYAPNCREAAKGIGISGTAVSRICCLLADEGRMVRTKSRATGKTIFLPVVV